MEKMPLGILETKKKKYQSENKEEISQGGRNDHLFKKACFYKKKKLNFKEVLELIQLENNNCIPPLETDELFQIVSSCFNNSNKEEIIVVRLSELYDDSKFEEPIPIVKGLINRGEFHLCSATAKTGKTLLQLNLVKAIAKGESFLGEFETTKGKILVIQTEVTNNNLRTRIKQIFGEDITDIEDSVFFVNQRIKIDTIEGLESLEELISDLNPDLVILDPFYTLHSKNEDSSSDIGPILSDLREVVLQTDVALLMIHHQGKSKESNSQTGHKHRGSSSFADAPDGSWSLQRSGGGDLLTLHFEMRNIEAPGPYQVRMDSDTLRFEITQKIKTTNEGISFIDITEFITENPGLAATKLKEELSSLYNIGVKTIGNKLSDAVHAGVLHKKKEGRVIKYYLTTKQEQPEIKF
jgi:KaiC/GvpD/RAD55 family RecA-like ATPase